MVLTTCGYKQHDTRFMGPIRVQLAGSSQCGKTYFAQKLLQNANKLFVQKPRYVIYYHPEYLYEAPVN